MKEKGNGILLIVGRIVLSKPLTFKSSRFEIFTYNSYALECSVWTEPEFKLYILKSSFTPSEYELENIQLISGTISLK